MPDLGDLDRNIGPLSPTKPLRKPDPRKRPKTPESDRDRERDGRRRRGDDDGRTPHVDEYA
jgi:hypothetical protein